MSLINDALKRAKQAHDQQTPPAMRGAPLHTTPPATPQKSGVPPMLIMAILLFVAITVVAVFFLLRPAAAVSPKVIASEIPATGQPPATSQPHISAPAPIPQPTVAKPNPTQPGNTVPIPAPEPPPTLPIQMPTATPAVPAVAMPDPTQPATPAPSSAMPTPAFPEVRLQGILYQPSKPAAIINGRTLFVGGHFGDITIIAITRDTATVSWHGQSNVLTLPQ